MKDQFVIGTGGMLESEFGYPDLTISNGTREVRHVDRTVTQNAGIVFCLTAVSDKIV